MQSGRRYSLFATLRWTLGNLIVFGLIAAVPVVLREVVGFEGLRIPWVPIAVVGTAVAFYLGFKNNSSYERVWEARKIWGGIVNTSRSWTVAVRGFVTDLHATQPASPAELAAAQRDLVMRHLGWLHALALQLRERREWEHYGAGDTAFREQLGTLVKPESYDRLAAFVGEDELRDVRSQKNAAVHLLDRQSQALAALRKRGWIDDFRHMELQNLVTELFALQGKSERIKNFPFPRQYASMNLFFVWLFIFLVPFGMVELFDEMGDGFVWLTIPFSMLVSWVFHTMEMVGDYSENPFEGIYNDVPITTIAAGIEVDLRQMIDDDQLPEVPKPMGSMQISV